MNKYLPVLMVIAFWGIFLWGISNPKVGEAIIAITIVGVVIFIIIFGKRIISKFIDIS